MSSRLQDLQDLASMLDEGKISLDEYELVKRELIDASPEEWSQTTPETEEASVPIPSTATVSEPDGPVTDSGVGSEEARTQLIFGMPPIYLASGIAAALTLLFGAGLAPLGWVTLILGVAALRASAEVKGRTLAFWALALGLAFTVVNLMGESGATPPATDETSVTVPQTAVAPADSLGLRLADVSEGWNSVPTPPLIVGGIVVSPEAGALDGFLYRFDSSAVLAGAYDPDDGYLYALMVRVSLSHPSVSNLFTHLCAMVHPSDQACLEEWVDQSGVFGVESADLEGAVHTSDWEFAGNQWRLSVENDVETIRVLAPGGLSDS